ncbi:hypothetical protein CBL_12420 [Carabus blaptoides fortunei]
MFRDFSVKRWEWEIYVQYCTKQCIIVFSRVGDIMKVLAMNVITCGRSRKRKFQRLCVVYLVVAGRKSAKQQYSGWWLGTRIKLVKAQLETATNCLYVRAISIATTLIIIEFGRPLAWRKETALYGRGLTTSDHA